MGRVCSALAAAAIVNLVLHLFHLNENLNRNDVLSVAQGYWESAPRSAGSSTSASGMTAEEQKRILKYVQEYRYIPPAPRYDYNPYPAPECGEAPNFNNFFTLDGKQRSRLNEDKFIYETFFKSPVGSNSTRIGPPIGDGTYVEIGAFNGLQESNSHFFEKCLGWEGLLVEGNPINYHQVISNRQFVHKMSFAPSCKEVSTVQFSRYPMTNAGIKGYAKTYDEKPMVNVTCGPFSPVLEDIFNGRRINFFSLDVEGAESLVLDTIDFSKIHVDVWMIEIKNNHCQADCEVRRQVREKMKQEGYKRYENLVHASDIYVDPKSIYQIPESRARAVE